MSNAQVPEWLHQALSSAPAAPVGFPEEGEWPIDALPGDIRAALPMDGGDVPARLVLILESFSDGDSWANVCLIGDAPEASGNRDIRLDPEETSATFPLLVQTDVVGPLFMVQLGPRVGHVEAPLLASLRSAVYGEIPADLAGRYGMPIVGSRDARWQLKDAEVSAMHGLAHDCMQHLLNLDRTEGAVSVVLDPAFITADVQPSTRSMLRVVTIAARKGFTLDVPLPSPNETARLEEWMGSLDSDEVRAMEALWQGFLRRPETHEAINEPNPEWADTWQTPGAQSLGRHLAGRAAGGTRAFRVLTQSELWPSPGQKGVFAFHSEQIGRIQVKPEWVTEAA
jgi:hypothetical protein